MPNHIHGIIEITSVGADSISALSVGEDSISALSVGEDSISAKDTGAEMDSAPTLAKTRFGHAEIYRID